MVAPGLVVCRSVCQLSRTGRFAMHSDEQKPERSQETRRARSELLTIQSYTLYHSPNAYLGAVLAERRLAGLPVAVERRPIFVPRARGVKVADLVGGVETAVKSSYHREDCTRWARRLGVELSLLPSGAFEERARRWAASRWEREELPARAYYAALGSGREADLDRALFRAAWVLGADVNDEDVVRDAAEAAGLDGDRLLEQARGDDARLRLEDALAAFERDGCPGVPTWVVRGERFWGKDRVDLLAERIAEIAREDADACDESGAALRVRPYARGDRDAVIALWRAAFPSEAARNEPSGILERALARDRDALLVAERAGAVAGVVIAGWDGHRGWIYHLAVDETLRRRGIGRALLAEAERRLRALGCPKANLQVMPENRAAVRFYERVGYAREDRISFGKLV